MVDGPVYYMAMPVNADGNGPASDEDIADIVHEVWDPHCNTVCTAPSEEMARFIVACINAAPSHLMQNPA